MKSAISPVWFTKTHPPVTADVLVLVVLCRRVTGTVFIVSIKMLTWVVIGFGRESPQVLLLCNTVSITQNSTTPHPMHPKVTHIVVLANAHSLDPLALSFRTASFVSRSAISWRTAGSVWNSIFFTMPS